MRRPVRRWQIFRLQAAVENVILYLIVQTCGWSSSHCTRWCFVVAFLVRAFFCNAILVFVSFYTVMRAPGTATKAHLKFIYFFVIDDDDDDNVKKDAHSFTRKTQTRSCRMYCFCLMSFFYSWISTRSVHTNLFSPLCWSIAFVRYRMAFRKSQPLI